MFTNIIYLFFSSRKCIFNQDFLDFFTGKQDNILSKKVIFCHAAFEKLTETWSCSQEKYLKDSLVSIGFQFDRFAFREKKTRCHLSCFSLTGMKTEPFIPLISQEL